MIVQGREDITASPHLKAECPGWENPIYPPPPPSHLYIRRVVMFYILCYIPLILTAPLFRPEAGQFGLSVLRALRLLRIFKVTK